MPEGFNQGLEHRRYLCYPSESFAATTCTSSTRLPTSDVHPLP
jgi:hypothetical protein